MDPHHFGFLVPDPQTTADPPGFKGNNVNQNLLETRIAL